ncbi:MAG: hypothetical protein ACJ789_11310 [Thermomicrobiales bacterium]
MSRSGWARRLDRVAPLVQQPASCPTCRGWLYHRLCDPSATFCLDPSPCPTCGKDGPVTDITMIASWGPYGEATSADPTEDEAFAAIVAARTFADYYQLGPTRSVGKLAAWYEARAAAEQSGRPASG